MTTLRYVATGLLKTVAVLLAAVALVGGFAWEAISPQLGPVTLTLGVLLLAALGLWSFADWLGDP